MTTSSQEARPDPVADSPWTPLSMEDLARIFPHKDTVGVFRILAKRTTALVATSCIQRDCLGLKVARF